jgi:hypothetical protein
MDPMRYWQDCAELESPIRGRRREDRACHPDECQLRQKPADDREGAPEDCAGTKWDSLTWMILARRGCPRQLDRRFFLLPHPKRIHYASHLQFVASLPCVVCGRSPSQAHHLKFAQLRTLASKSSDKWAVPLCLLHHRALHDVGAEEAWWEERGIDAKGKRNVFGTKRQAVALVKLASASVPNEEGALKVLELAVPDGDA